MFSSHPGNAMLPFTRSENRAIEKAISDAFRSAVAYGNLLGQGESRQLRIQVTPATATVSALTTCRVVVFIETPYGELRRLLVTKLEEGESLAVDIPEDAARMVAARIGESRARSLPSQLEAAQDLVVAEVRSMKIPLVPALPPAPWN